MLFSLNFRSIMHDESNYPNYHPYYYHHQRKNLSTKHHLH